MNNSNKPNKTPYTHPPLRPDRRFLRRWVWGNTVGLGVGLTIGQLGASGMLAGPLRLVAWGLAGVVVGSIQQWLLRRQLASNGWTWATMLGWLVGGVVAGGEGIDWGLMGGLIGLGQWVILRRSVARAGWWLLANAMGLIFSTLIGWSVRFSSRWTLFKTLFALLGERMVELLDWGLAGLVSGAVAGAVTGLWLMWLLQAGGEHEIEPA